MCKNNSFDSDEIEVDTINVFKQYGIGKIVGVLENDKSK